MTFEDWWAERLSAQLTTQAVLALYESAEGVVAIAEGEMRAGAKHMLRSAMLFQWTANARRWRDASDDPNTDRDLLFCLQRLRAALPL